MLVCLLVVAAACSDDDPGGSSRDQNNPRPDAGLVDTGESDVGEVDAGGADVGRPDAGSAPGLSLAGQLAPSGGLSMSGSYTLKGFVAPGLPVWTSTSPSYTLELRPAPMRTPDQ